MTYAPLTRNAPSAGLHRFRPRAVVRQNRLQSRKPHHVLAGWLQMTNPQRPAVLADALLQHDELAHKMARKRLDFVHLQDEPIREMLRENPPKTVGHVRRVVVRTALGVHLDEEPLRPPFDFKVPSCFRAGCLNHGNRSFQ